MLGKNIWMRPMLCNQFDDAFLSVAVEKGISNGVWSQCRNNAWWSCYHLENVWTMFWHMKQFFGRTLFISEKMWWAYYRNNDFPPEGGHEIIPDKTIISYCWKKPDILLQHQIKQMVNPEDLHGLQRVDICTGGDHEGGRFRMLFWFFFHFMDKSPITRLFEIANVFHSQDDVGILNRIFLQKKSDG